MSLIDNAELASLPPRPLRAAADGDDVVIRRSFRDASVFALIFERHWPRIHAYCVGRAGAAPGEDIAAETFRVAFAKRRRFGRGHPDAAPWLYGIATNLIREHFRRTERAQRATLRIVAAASPQSDDAIGRVEAQQLGPAVAGALAALPAADRDALLLFAWADLGYEGIARAMDVPIGTVRSRINRARTRLQHQLDTRSDHV